MAIVVLIHTFGADQVITLLTKILYLLVLVLEAVDTMILRGIDGVVVVVFDGARLLLLRLQ